ncbi:MAG: hypothetical protein QW620_08310 [Thermoplasmata archaeon]
MESLIAVLLFIIFSTPLLLAIYTANASRFQTILRADKNKLENKRVPTAGGIFLLPAIICILATLIGDFGVALALAVLVAGAIGLADDLKGSGIWLKVPLMMLPSLPLIIFWVAGEYKIEVPWFLSLFPLILLLPFITSFFSNAFNIISGYDGLSMGIGVIQLGTLGVLAFLANNMALCSVALLSLLVLGTLLLFNWYPSIVFPGNSGTFIVGTLMPLLFIYGGFWLPLMFLYIPHICEFLFKLRFGGRTDVFGSVDAEGLITYSGKPKSVIHLLLIKGRWKELDVTTTFLGLEGVFAVIALALVFI